MKKIFTGFLLLITTVASSQKKIDENGIERLKKLMTGTFSSHAQAKADTNFLSITLHMKELASTSKDFWLYVEQAVTTAQERPYRQRVYHVSQTGDAGIVSQVYELKDAKHFIGAWKNDSLQTELKNFLQAKDAESFLKNFTARQGCAIYLKKKVKIFLALLKAPNVFRLYAALLMLQVSL